MITSIREGAKAIVRYVLDEAVNCGNLKNSISVKDDELAEKLDFDKSKRFVVCIQYLAEKGLISSAKTDDVRHLTLTAAAIDFMEET